MIKFDPVKEVDIGKSIEYYLEMPSIKKIEGSGQISRSLPSV